MAKLQLKSSALKSKELMGKEIHEVNWQEGIEEFTIRFDNFTTIPWILPHWFGEKNIRLQEIKAWGNSRTFMTRAVGIFTNDKKSKQALTRTTGKELLKILEINSTKLTKSLKNTPQNAELRTQLVQKTFERLKQKQTASLQHYRALLLQAFIANSFGEVSSDSLLLLRNIQDRYYLMAQRICQDRITKNQPRDNDSPERKKDKEKIVALSQTHLKIMESDKKYLSTKLRRIQETAKHKKFVLRLDDFKKWSRHNKNAETLKNKLFCNTWEAVQIMRCFPLLHEDAQELADQVIEMDPQNPLGIFLKGYIAIAEADLLIKAFRGGYKSQNKFNKIQDILRNTIKYYEQALLQIGDDYCAANLNILSEYANTVLFMHNMGKMGKSVPRVVLQRYIKNIKNLLITAYHRTESKSIKNALLKMELVSEELKGFASLQTKSA